MPFAPSTSQKEHHPFEVNYLGHFLLTTELLPVLTRTAKSKSNEFGVRVVQLTSGAHRAAPAEGVPLTLKGAPILAQALRPYKKLLVTSATLVVTGALLVVTRS